MRGLNRDLGGKILEVEDLSAVLDAYINREP